MGMVPKTKNYIIIYVRMYFDAALADWPIPKMDNNLLKSWSINLVFSFVPLLQNGQFYEFSFKLHEKWYRAFGIND